MSDEDFRKLCNVYGFAPSRALRELIDCATARQWQNLTDEEIKEIVGPWGDTPIKGYTRKLFDQIEAKLKEKNT